MKHFYLPSLDGVRACAFLLVFVAHAGLDKIVPGGLGVTIFFLLSGYLITTLLRKEFSSTGSISMKNFYIRRSLRILPPMYVTLGLACLVGFAVPSLRSATLLGVVSVLTYFYNYADLINNSAAKLPGGMGVLWSLMIEEHFYLIFPFVYLALLRSRMTRSRQAAVLGAVCGAALLWRCYLVLWLHTSLQTLPRWTYSATDTRFDSILWGCILAILWNPVFDDGSEWLKRNAGTLAAAGLLLLAFTLVVRNPVFRETLRYSLQSVALIPIFHYCVARPQAWASRCLQWTPLRWIGWLSYSLYLVHDFLLTVARTYFHLRGLETAVLVFAATVLYALAVRYAIELPSRKIQQSLTIRRQSLVASHPAEVTVPGN